MCKALKLTDDETNSLLAGILGQASIGDVLYYHDPDCGRPQVQPEQEPYEHASMKTYVGQAYVADCMCSEELEIFGELRHSRIHGHCYLCLDIVPRYVEDDTYLAMLITKYKVSVIPNYSGWNAKCLSDQSNVWVIEDSLTLAVAKAIVKSVYGDNLDIVSE